MLEDERLACPVCSSQQLEKLVLIFRKIKYGPFLQDHGSCPWRSECLNAGSQRCRICHRKVVVLRHMLSKASEEILRFTDSSDNWRHFRTKEV
jgi:hypothetical protein